VAGGALESRDQLLDGGLDPAGRDERDLVGVSNRRDA